MITATPTVTIAIPTYNEAAYIEHVLLAMLHTSYPHVLEVLVVDGDSCDGTQAIVLRVAAKHSRVRLLHNPYRIQSAGLNMALAEAQGAVLIRADAHCTYAPDYVEQCVAVLLRTRALNVGGAQRFVATTPFQAGVALAARSRFFSGGAKYRDVGYEGAADTVFLGCFWRTVLQMMRGYRCCIHPAEDIELNLRLRQMHSNAIYISPDIKVWYHPRMTWRAFVKQYVNHGKGASRIRHQHPWRVHARGMLPVLTVSLGMLMLLGDSLLLRGKLRMRALALVAIMLPWIESLRLTVTLRDSFAAECWRGDSAHLPSAFQRWLWCGVSLSTLPVAHAVGFVIGFYQNRSQKRCR